ncbi:MAG: sigma-70 family RNA polymerase sigma factor [Verrucomicrobiales bacterium]|nr:sigma-70 family RNA polymerase sigma factor [Verrucomicrobiales bacterium]
MDREKEKQLVLDVQAGKLEAFEELILEHGSRLRAFVAMKLPIPHLIDELAHEAFVFAHHHIHDFEAGTNFGKWLRAIAFNLVRKETLRHQRVSKNNEKFLEHCLVQSSNTAGFTPEAPVFAHLEECVNQLPEGQRKLLGLKYKLVQSTREMAAVLQQSEAWVRTTLCRVRSVLRDCLERKAMQEAKS